MVSVWTGASATGLLIGGLQLGATFPMSGSTSELNTNWIQQNTDSQTTHLRLYAMSAELTVIPEPSTMMLACIGATAVVGWQLRRRRHRRRQ